MKEIEDSHPESELSKIRPSSLSDEGDHFSLREKLFKLRYEISELKEMMVEMNKNLTIQNEFIEVIPQKIEETNKKLAHEIVPQPTYFSYLRDYVLPIVSSVGIQVPIICIVGVRALMGLGK